MSIRHIRRSVLMAAAIAALAVGGLYAGRLFARQLGPGGPGSMHGAMAAHMFDHISRELDLSDAQRSQIREILKSHADEILAQVRAGMDARHALHGAVMAQPTDEASIRQFATQVGAVHADGALLFAKVRSEVWPVLTPEQQQKFTSFHDRMGQRGDQALQSLEAFLRGAN